MAQAASHNGMRTGLSILTFDKARAEPLDSYEITKKSPPPPRLSASMCAELKVPGWCHQTSLSVYHNLEQHSFGPVSPFLSHGTMQTLPLDDCSDQSQLPPLPHPLFYGNQDELVAPLDFGLMLHVCAKPVIGFIWPHDPAAGDICLHLAYRQTSHSQQSACSWPRRVGPLGCIRRGLRRVLWTRHQEG